MAMSDQQLLVLLGVIAAHDGRILDEPTEALWRRAAHRYGWTFEQCVEAVDEFFAEPLELGKWRPKFDPGQMRRMLRALRPGGTGPAPAAQVLDSGRQALTVGKASEAKRAQVMAAVREHLPSRHKGRKPWWDPARVSPDAADDGSPVVELDRAQRQFRALTGGRGASEPSTAFGRGKG